VIDAPLLVTGDLRVIAVRTPLTTQRDSARQLVRQALVKALADLLAVEEGAISLRSAPGQAIHLAAPWQHIGISVSHESGLSLAAIHLAGAVGVDLMRLDPALANLDVLARDYLGPETAAAIAALPETERQLAFAGGWTRLEAGLKCLGTALGEWTPEIGRQLADCAVSEIEMPAGWVAAVAIPGPTHA